MTNLPRQLRKRAGQLTLLAVAAMVYAFSAHADDSAVRGFALRNQNPFLQVFGLPTFQSAEVAQFGKLEYRFSLDLANHADAGDSAAENFVIDGETYFLTMSLRRRVGDWLELGVDVPVVSHSDGFMDNMIESWHDTFGMSNTKRRGPGNQLSFLYEREGQTLYALSAPSSGIGDVQLTAAIPIREALEEGPAVAVRSSLKLPTGDADKLQGSGATDLSLGLHVADTRTLWNRNLGLAGFAGVLLLGEGDVLPTLQRDALAFGGISVTWQATDRLALATQLYAQGAYFDSDVEELGGNTVQLAVGADYRTRGSGILLRFAVVEDVSANATTDFALHFSIHSGGG